MIRIRPSKLSCLTPCISLPTQFPVSFLPPQLVKPSQTNLLYTFLSCICWTVTVQKSGLFSLHVGLGHRWMMPTVNPESLCIFLRGQWERFLSQGKHKQYAFSLSLCSRFPYDRLTGREKRPILRTRPGAHLIERITPALIWFPNQRLGSWCYPTAGPGGDLFCQSLSPL